MNRTKTIVIRVNETEHAKIVRTAGGSGNVSAFVRERTLTTEGRRNDDRMKSHRLLAMINNNLFFLARAHRENRIDNTTVLAGLVCIERALKDHFS